mmetsp:Transcript_12884/g.19373  ORF Transcript_12884/g.19373 Transcript_12884/m.19373 type:complete len:86 (+) Transcript_12884:113-370(+)
MDSQAAEKFVNGNTDATGFVHYSSQCTYASTEAFISNCDVIEKGHSIFGEVRFLSSFIRKWVFRTKPCRKSSVAQWCFDIRRKGD